MHPILFKFGSFTIYTYGFFVFLGVLFGYFFCLKQAKRENINKSVFSDIIFWTLIFSFLGARVFYIFADFENFLLNPLEILLSRSGFVFYGGVVFGIIALYALAKLHKINFFKLSDIIVSGVPLAHAFGRLGCFSYGCCYGRPTDSFLGVLFPKDSPAGFAGVRVIPTQLIEALSLFLLFLALIFLRKRKKFDGQLLAFYLIFYSIIRFIIEFLRGDPRGSVFFLSLSQFISVILMVFGIFLHFWLRLRKQQEKTNKTI
ncbi:MAG: prolipoprotein diacylglyceryl transferase [Candidatus Omnitrophica bacterium]|jgi:phosphatidylglycerol:prolipoprotein diacylglycerol transferase|nr:prolipoprotein diacylglyceryl transferase [Candidatus Omnitrophota bacterium]